MTYGSTSDRLEPPFWCSHPPDRPIRAIWRRLNRANRAALPDRLLAELAAAGLADEPRLPLFTIVDYDPAGDSVAHTFVWQMRAHGYTGQMPRVDLVHPSHLSSEAIRLNRYPLPSGRGSRKRNQRWAARTHGLEPWDLGLFYGLEAESIPWDTLVSVFEREVAAELHVPAAEVERQRLDRELIDVLQRTLLGRLTVA